MSSQFHLTQPLIECPRSCSILPTWLADPLIAIKSEPINRFAVQMLNVKPEDQVLEIGCGQGHAVQMIAERTAMGLAAGIDPSSHMVRQAAKRNRELIKSGRVELCQGSVSNIPYEYARFNKVLAVDNYQFWPHAEFNLTEVQRVLEPGGLLVLCLRKKEQRGWLQRSPGFTSDEMIEIAGLVRWVGFHDVRIVQRHAHDEAACVTARR